MSTDQYDVERDGIFAQAEAAYTRYLNQQPCECHHVDMLVTVQEEGGLTREECVHCYNTIDAQEFIEQYLAERGLTA